jgi:hypothetical protein
MRRLTDKQRRTLFYKALLWSKLHKTDDKELPGANCYEQCKYYLKCYGITKREPISEKGFWHRDLFTSRMGFCFCSLTEQQGKTIGAGFCYGFLWPEEEELG